MGSERNGIIEFGSFRIDLANRLLLKNGEVVALAPKTFDLLAVLIENQGAVLDKETLFRKVWPNAFVEESSLTKNISLLRKCLGDGPDGRAYIETFPRRGYRFQATFFERHASTGEAKIDSKSGGSASRIPPTKLLWGSAAVLAGAAVLLVWIVGRKASPTLGIRSIAVLPFRTLGGPDYLADGITEELTVRLSRIASLRVVSAQVAMRFKSVTDPRDVGRQLATDGVLLGVVRAGQGQIRVSAQLVSVRDGSVIWADAGSGEGLEDLLDAESRVVSSLVERLQLRLTPVERSVVERRATGNREAHECLLLGKSLFAESRRGAARLTNNRAIELFRRAILLDPSYPNAYAWLAVALSGPYQPAESHQAAVAYAQKALDLDSDQVVARRALIELSDELGKARAGLPHAKRVLEIGPGDPQAFFAAGKAYFRAGMADKAIALFETAVKIDPDFEEGRTELSFALNFSGYPLRVVKVFGSHARPSQLLWPMVAYSDSGNIAKALEIARDYSPQPGHPTGWLALGIVWKESGKPEEARRTWMEGATQAEAELRVADEYRKRVILALIYARLGQAAEAREHIRRSLSLNPGHPWTLFLAGEMEGLLGNPETALSYVRQAVERDWLQLPYFDHYQRPDHGLHIIRNDPRFRDLRNEVARRVEDLRKRY